jgi:hypothetical protein
LTDFHHQPADQQVQHDVSRHLIMNRFGRATAQCTLQYLNRFGKILFSPTWAGRRLPADDAIVRPRLPQRLHADTRILANREGAFGRLNLMKQTAAPEPLIHQHTVRLRTEAHWRPDSEFARCCRAGHIAPGDGAQTIQSVSGIHRRKAEESGFLVAS